MRVPRAALGWIFALWVAAPASGDLRVYELSGDQSMLLPTDGTIIRPGIVSGTARIDESGADPVLAELSLHVGFVERIGNLAGPPLILEWTWSRDLGPAPGQSGSGSTSSSISWGTLTGWSQTGHIVCPSDCLLGDCDTACINFVGYAGTGPPLPLKGPEIDTGTWSFAPGATSFDVPGFEVGNIAGGAVTESLSLRGVLAPPVPAAPLAGLAALALALCWAATRWLPTRHGPKPPGFGRALRAHTPDETARIARKRAAAPHAGSVGTAKEEAMRRIPPSEKSTR